MKTFPQLSIQELRLWVFLPLIFFGFSLYGQDKIRFQIIPNNTINQVGDEFELSIHIESNDVKVSAAELSLVYNPEIFEVLSIDLSDENPLENLLPGKRIDNSTGQIFMGSFSIVPVSDGFEYAKLKCVAKKRGQSALEFIIGDKKGTQVSYRGENMNISGKGSTITVE